VNCCQSILELYYT